MRAFSVLVFAIFATSVFGNNPDQVVKQYLDAVSSGEFEHFGALFHPDEVARLREEVEPLIEKNIRRRDGRQMFGAFIDPYEPKKLRSIGDDEFMEAFARWIKTWNADAMSMISQTEGTVLGHVEDGEKRHVVVRLSAEIKGRKWESLVIRTTKDFEGDQLLLLPGEITSAVDLLRDFR